MSTGFENKKRKTETSFTSNVNSFDMTSKFQEYFTQVNDPRVERTRWHSLTDIITIAILAVIAGAQGWEDIEEYGLNKQEWLETFLELPFGIPSPDTIRRVFEKINPKEFEQCFRQWVQALVEKLGVEVIAIDGKNHRGSYDRASELKALHVVSAWSNEHRLVLGQTKVSAKSNEITAIRQHWGIENSVHWTLDVTFGEDECRIRSVHSPQNFALLRRIALNALERETSFRRRIRQKSRRAAMNDVYMVSVLVAALPNSVSLP